MTDKIPDFNVIEFSMLKKHLFFPLSGVGSFTAQTLLYPFILLRTRLQLQEGVQVYRGLFHSLTTVVREEGFRGLYSGYFIRSIHIVSGSIYVSTYELTRNAFSTFPSLSSAHRSCIGGAVASFVAQGFFVPIDVISQHLMVINRNRLDFKTSNYLVKDGAHVPTKLHPNCSLSPICLTKEEMNSNWSRIYGVIRYIRNKHGSFGLYKGFAISLCTFIPSSALWWFFYDTFCGLFFLLSTNLRSRNQLDDSFDVNGSNTTSRLPIQLISAPLAGISSSIIMNPLDCVRVRMQVSHLPFRRSVMDLWKTEGLTWFVKGLSARLVQTTFYSFWLILVYEPIKIFCLKDDYRDQFITLNT